MKRKQSLLHLDQRQTMLLENAYYQVRRARRSILSTHRCSGKSP
jgi:hypothetical protein